MTVDSGGFSLRAPHVSPELRVMLEDAKQNQDVWNGTSEVTVDRTGSDVNRQDWRCEQCGRFGNVKFADDEGVDAVRNRIEAAHAKIAKECHADWGMSYVRLAADA